MFKSIKELAKEHIEVRKTNRTRRNSRREAAQYEAMIAASQAHLDSIPVADGYVNVYA